MIRHANSLVLSLIVHLLILLVAFYVMKEFVVDKPVPEQRVCIHLHSCGEQLPSTARKQEKEIPIATPPKIEKRVNREKRVKTEHKVLKKNPPQVQKKRVVHKIKEQVREIPKIEKVTQTQGEQKEQVQKNTGDQQVLAEIKQEIQGTPVKKVAKISAKKEYLKVNLSKISLLLQENLYYPRRARKRGIQGEVLVKFELSKNAEVSVIEVLSSSSDILSRGAIRTIEGLSEKFPKPSEKLTLNIPIVYKLN